MAQLKLIRASAGSGKTFNLTRNFLEMVLNEPNASYYRHILAVTFTNKATAEMKERILKELHLLASNQASAHLEHLMQVTRKTEKRIRNLSNAILSHILHGYSWFRVETIDTFFQGVIRSFVRELNIPGHYNIELDQDKILEEAANRLLDKLHDKHKLVNWLLQYIEGRIAQGKSWVIKNELQNIGKSLFKENFINHLPVMEKVIEEENFLKTYHDTLHEIVTHFEKKITGKAEEVLSEIQAHGFTDKDFYYKGSGTISYFKNIINGKYDASVKRMLQLVDNPDKWPAKDCDRKDEAVSLGINLMNPAFVAIQEILEKEMKDYNTASSILKNLHILGLLTQLQKELKEIKSEKSIMLISDASPFIQRIINHNDAPFIYEKIGNQFHHLLIDEFQDTSSMQWGNFKPLVSNSLSNNFDCLLVGDVKQSIYRWRNSNWEIIAHGVKSDFTHSMIHEEPLTTNWRSAAGVIRFNNAFFQKASSVFQEMVHGELSDIAPIQSVYGDVVQEVPQGKATAEGYVYFKAFSKEQVKDSPDFYAEELVNNINGLLAKGYEPGQIAVLVRNLREGAAIANFLVNANKEQVFAQHVGVISNESLFLEGSPVVKLLLAAMRFINMPANRLLAANLYNAYQLVFSSTGQEAVPPAPGNFKVEMLNDLLPKKFLMEVKALQMNNLYSIAEQVTQTLELNTIKAEEVYLHSFLDLVFNFTNSEYSELNSFLEYWEDEGFKKTISAAETPGSIRILTIHKSKGLEFPAIIIPFCNWEFEPKTSELMWFTANEAPYNKLPLIPVNYTNALQNSIFTNDYLLENYRTLIDNLNILYVAFTRAQKALFVYTPQGRTGNTVADVAQNVLEAVMAEKQIAGLTFNTENTTYTMGEIPPAPPLPQTNHSRLFSSGHTQTRLPNVRISSQAEKFLKHMEDKEDAAARGTIYHAIMEKIVVKPDIEKSVNNFMQEGIIDKNEADEIVKQIKEGFKSDLIESWFHANNTVLTETSIIGLTGKTKRPDRVVIHNHQVTVIDYKFGSQDEKEKHLNQVKQYKFLIKNMGYTHVKGFVWYVLEGKTYEAV